MKGSPTVGNRRKQFDIDCLLDALVWHGRSSSTGTYWRAGNVGPGRARESPLPMHLVAGSPAAQQSRYMRPLLPAVTYYSNDGNSAPYGQQWREGVPAPDSYGWTATWSDSPAFIPLPLPCSNIRPATTTLRYAGAPCTPGICC